MKIKIQQTKLAKALNYVSRAVSQKPNIPVLSNVLMVVNRDQLQLSATNLDMGINMWVPGVAEDDGKVTASGKFLTDFIAAAGGERVDISLTNDVLHVNNEDAKAEFNTIPANEFPVLPRVEGESFLTIKTVELINGLEKAIFACATDVTTSRIQLTGVLFELEQDKQDIITFVGLNGFRLSRKTAVISRASTEAMQLIVPARPLQELVKILNSEDVEEVQVYLSSNRSQIIFKIEDIELSIRLLEGPYPEYRSVLPTEHSYSFEVDKGEFERALKVVNTFARSAFGSRVYWDLDLETGTLLMHTSVTDLGRNEVRISVQNASGNHDLKDAYGLQFLLDMVNHMSGSTIRFETKEALLPALFKDKDDKDYVHLIMPMARED